MSRTTAEIASDIKGAVVVMAESNAASAALITGNVPVSSPPIVVRLKDGREVELGALADELLASLA